MEKDKPHTELDSFSQLIKDKLEGCQLPVDDNCWAEIEKRLNSGKRKRAIPLWLWISSGGFVAAAAVLLFIFTPFIEGIQQQNLAEQIQQISDEQQNLLEPKSNFISDYSEGGNLKKPLQITETDIQKNGTIVAKQNADNKDNTVICSKTDIKSEELAENTIPAKENTETDSERREEKEKTEKTKNIELPQYNPYDPANADWQPKKKKRQDNWLVAASVNTGGRSFSGGKDINPNSMGNGFLELSDDFNGSTISEINKPLEFSLGEDMSNVENKRNYLNTMESSDFSSVTHLPPLSFGLRVRKDFNDYFALESGLNYTYLSSKFSDKHSFDKESSLNMHYLGIPVNAAVYLVNNPKWNMYFLAGGMLEKGVWSIYKERIRLSDNNYRDYSDSNHIKGLQWSLNASFGVDYNFYRNFSFYFEPNIAYYLENNQPLSVRTESPLIVGLNAGIRYRLGH